MTAIRLTVFRWLRDRLEQCPECGHEFVRATPMRELGVDAPGELRELLDPLDRPASRAQLDALRRAGYPERELRNVTRRAASRLLTQLGERRAAGPCTPKQARALRGCGLRDNLNFHDAHIVLAVLEANGWRPTPELLETLRWPAVTAGGAA